MHLRQRIQRLIIERSRLLIVLLWIFWLMDLGKFLVDDRPLLWLALLGGGLLLVLTILVYRTAEAQLSMYITVILMYFYTSLMMLNSPSLVNYMFAWVGLIISAYYQEYGPILLAGVLTAVYQGHLFLVYRTLMFPGARPVDVIYPLLFCFFITTFLIYLTTFTKRLWLSAEHAEQQLRYVLENVDVITWNMQRFGEAPAFSSGVQEIVGISAEELGRASERWLELIHPEDLAVTEQLISDVKEGKCEEAEFRFVRPDGETRWVQARVVPIRAADGRVEGMQGVLMDVTKRRSMEEQIKYLAYNDQLTGLPNRPAFLETARESLRLADIDGSRRAVLFIDLDGFKQVNDTAGHEIGDRVLALIAQRLQQAVQKGRPLCRLGGDEFAVLLNVEQPDEAIVMAERIIESLTQPIVFGRREFHIGCSIGISHYPEHGLNVDALLRNADRAMYQAKADGSILSRWHVYRQG